MMYLKLWYLDSIVRIRRNNKVNKVISKCKCDKLILNSVLHVHKIVDQHIKIVIMIHCTNSMNVFNSRRLTRVY